MAAGGSQSLETTMGTHEQNLPETHARLANLLRTKPFSFGRGDEELSTVALAAAQSTFDSGSPKTFIIIVSNTSTCILQLFRLSTMHSST